MMTFLRGLLYLSIIIAAVSHFWVTYEDRERENFNAQMKKIRESRPPEFHLLQGLRRGDIKMIEAAFKKGADANKVDGEYNTPMLGLTRYMFRVTPEERETANTPKEYRIEYSLKILEAMLKGGLDPNPKITREPYWNLKTPKVSPSPTRNSLLFLVSGKFKKRCTDYLNLLRQYGARFEDVDLYGNNIVHKAVETRNACVLTFLTRLEMSFNKENYYGETPLDILLKRFNPENELSPRTRERMNERSLKQYEASEKIYSILKSKGAYALRNPIFKMKNARQIPTPKPRRFHRDQRNPAVPLQSKSEFFRPEFKVNDGEETSHKWLLKVTMPEKYDVKSVDLVNLKGQLAAKNLKNIHSEKVGDRTTLIYGFDDLGSKAVYIRFYFAHVDEPFTSKRPYSYDLTPFK